MYVIALVVWWFELTGMPREWFYESSLYAVVGGTVFTLIFSVIAVFRHPEREGKKLVYGVVGRTGAGDFAVQ